MAEMAFLAVALWQWLHNIVPLHSICTGLYVLVYRCTALHYMRYIRCTVPLHIPSSCTALYVLNLNLKSTVLCMHCYAQIWNLQFCAFSAMPNTVQRMHWEFTISNTILGKAQRVAWTTLGPPRNTIWNSKYYCQLSLNTMEIWYVLSLKFGRRYQTNVYTLGTFWMYVWIVVIKRAWRALLIYGRWRIYAAQKRYKEQEI